MAAIKLKGMDHAVTNFAKTCYAYEPFMQVRTGLLCRAVRATLFMNLFVER